MLRVSIAVGGRFAAFDIARALEKRGNLEQLLSSYIRAPWERLSIRRVAWSPWLDAARRVGVATGRTETAERWFLRAFDRWASRNLRPCSLLQGWSGFCVEVLARAKSLGATTVLLRGSAHIMEQERLLREEHARLAVNWRGIPTENVDRELEGYERADYIQVLSSFSYRSFVNRGVGPDRLFMLPLGVDLKQFSHGDSYVSPLERRRRPIILFVGSLSVEKGLVCLLKAFGELDIPADLHLIGGSPASHVLQRLPSGVHLHGRQSAGQLAIWYQQAAIAVVPSIQDGGPAVISEAMASGTPVVATEHTAGRDLLLPPRHGLVIPAGDVEALRAAIRMLLVDPDLAERMGRDARNWIRRHGTWSSFATTLLKAYAAMRSGSYSARLNRRLLVDAGFAPAPDVP